MANKPQAGKGDTYRSVNKKVYDQNFDDIDWKPKKKQPIGGKRITKEEAFKSLGDPSTWEKDAKKIRGEFQKKHRKEAVILDDFVKWDDGSSVVDPGGVVYDGSRNLIHWDDVGSVVDEGGPVCDGASKFLDGLRNKP